MNDDCLFCSIINNRIDSHTVYEDEHVLAFLDINPVSRGHTLVIPKTHADTLTDLNGEMTEHLFAAVNRVATGLEAALNPAGLNLLQSNGEAAGQEIHHMHVHLIPRYEDGDGLNLSFDQGELVDEDAHDIVDAVSKRLE